MSKKKDKHNNNTKRNIIIILSVVVGLILVFLFGKWLLFDRITKSESLDLKSDEALTVILKTKSYSYFDRLDSYKAKNLTNQEKLWFVVETDSQYNHGLNFYQENSKVKGEDVKKVLNLPLLPVWPPQRAEKVRKHLMTLLPQHPANERRAGGKVLHEQVQHPAAGAHRAVARAVVDPRDTRAQNRPRAHRARLERHIERAVLEPPAAEGAVRLADGLHLGVRAGRLLLLAAVAAAADNLAAAHDDASDRHLPRPRGLPRQQQRLLHIVFVIQRTAPPLREKLPPVIKARHICPN